MRSSGNPPTLHVSPGCSAWARMPWGCRTVHFCPMAWTPWRVLDSKVRVECSRWAAISGGGRDGCSGGQACLCRARREGGGRRRIRRSTRRRPCGLSGSRHSTWPQIELQDNQSPRSQEKWRAVVVRAAAGGEVGRHTCNLLGRKACCAHVSTAKRTHGADAATRTHCPS